MKNLIITNTHNIEGHSIKKYIDTISTNSVIGTNVVVDFFANITDIIGSKSGLYANVLERLYNDVINKLKDKAKKIGADGIVGLNVDFDEITGNGKSMFMASASGTAVLFEKDKIENDNIEENIITQDVIDFEIERQNIVHNINSNGNIETDWIDFLYTNPQKEIIENLLYRYIQEHTQIEIKNFIEKYLKLFSISDIEDIIYSKYIDNYSKIGELIKNISLFSAKHIIEILKINVHLAIPLLDTKKDFYKKEDLVLMEEIMNHISNLPNSGKIDLVKGGVLSKEQEKYICEKGHKNNKDVEFCETCGINIKGFNRYEIAIIKKFQKRIEIIKNIF